MKIAVLTDTHANLPALRAVLKEIKREGYDAAFHTGDAVGLGPWPAETVDLLEAAPRLHLLAGNHEGWLCSGVPAGAARWLQEHYDWLRERVERRHTVSAGAWPLLTEHDFEGLRTAFAHYALDGGGRLELAVSGEVAGDLDAMAGRHSSLLVFHGHRHRPSDLKGKVRYVNPGSLGCWHMPAARYLVARFHKGKVAIQHKAAAYDREELLKGYAASGMPDYRRILDSYFALR
jgi:predicted phosphodiesterase